MLAQLEPQPPRGDRWAYEPKFDGFRGRLWRRGDASAQLFSRNGRDLAPWFPERTRAAVVLRRGTLLRTWRVAERSRACSTATTCVCNSWRTRPTFRSPKRLDRPY